MRNSSRRPITLSAALAALPGVLVASSLMLRTPQASAAILTYDADTTAPANDGAGVWDTTTANWFNAASDVVWANTLSDTAIFGSGGAGGAVAVSTVNVGTIQLNQTTSSYTLNGGTITLGTGITGNSTTTNTINSVVTGSNGLVFTGAGTATVTLGGANTYSGITSLSATGRLQANNVAGFGGTAGATATTLGTDYTQVAAGGVAVANVNGIFNEAFLISGSGQSFSGAIRINNSPTFNSLIRLAAGAQILNNGGGTATFNGNIDTAGFAVNLQSNGAANPTIFNGDITGTGGVSLRGGTGPLVFNGDKSYTGATTLGIAAANTGTLAGSGGLSTSLLTVNAGGTLSPGATAGAIGAFSFVNDVTISGRYLVDLTAASSDTITVADVLNLSSATDVLTLQGVAGAPSYTLATFASLTGTFDVVNGVPAGYEIQYDATSIKLVNPSLIPEPATLGAAAAAMGLILRRRRA